MSSYFILGAILSHLRNAYDIMRGLRIPDLTISERMKLKRETQALADVIRFLEDIDRRQSQGH